MSSVSWGEEELPLPCTPHPDKKDIHILTPGTCEYFLKKQKGTLQVGLSEGFCRGDYLGYPRAP